jgi:hypothetical protein
MHAHTPLLQATPAPINLNEVADAEQLLEELDACGVSSLGG